VKGKGKRKEDAHNVFFCDFGGATRVPARISQRSPAGCTLRSRVYSTNKYLQRVELLYCAALGAPVLNRLPR
jgi:hypothetical protein